MDHRVKPGDDDRGCCARVRSIEFPIQFSNSARVRGLPHLRQRKTSAIALARVCASCDFSFAPQTTRGMERRKAHLVLFRFRHRCDAVCFRKARRLTALHSRRFVSRGPYFRVRMGELVDPRSGGLSPAFILSSSSRERQSHLVGPDGQPRPSGRCGCEPHRADAASCSASKAPSRSAPHEQDDREYIPRSENVNGRRVDFSGRPEFPLHVVPAKAGTHTPCVIDLKEMPEQSSRHHHNIRWLWVPAFAGTTSRVWR